MKRHPELRLEAEFDILNATQVHEESRPGYGARFLDAVETCLDAIAGEPLAFPEVDDGVRKALLRKFRYAVYFRIIDDDTIDVLAVVHHHQHHDTWRER
ncbi:MAG: type II toxin-antitoxin system RelE/ParE family toxin [Polyangiaceae bacterium]